MKTNVTLEAGSFDWDYVLRHDDGRTIHIQSDMEYCSVARYFGWSPCECGMTDGSVDCDHHSASAMIADAGEFLSHHIGEKTDDPGWFD